ncbi:TrbI/VirB10 family protein [Limnobacter alexandrii]|uniref:TrbI/VirB10 family protein n=1 Tax=Limnobacter alexandrii TaxID=2570352 RepID=UPI001109F0D4|nr:TrbI/VirB10 family protein [Limnobacter alexandrii]
MSIERTEDPSDSSGRYIPPEQVSTPDREPSIKRNLHKIFILIFVVVVVVVLFFDSIFGTTAQTQKEEAPTPAQQPGIAIDVKPNAQDVTKIATEQKAAAEKEAAPDPIPVNPIPGASGRPVSATPMPIPGLSTTNEDEFRRARQASEAANASMIALSGDSAIASLSGTESQSPDRAIQSRIEMLRAQDEQMRAEQNANLALAQRQDGGQLDRLASLISSGGQAQPSTQSPRAQDSNFLQSTSALGASKSALKVRPRTGEFLLCQGSIIPAVILNPIFSDLVGPIRARVVSDVYDCLGNGIKLIPKGAMVVGAYSNDIRIGQSKVLGAFSRIIFPNGSSVDLPGSQALDQMGTAGISGEVNTHFLKMLSTGLLLAVIADAADPDRTTTVGVQGTTSTGSAAGQVLTDVSRVSLERYRVIPATITTDPAIRINIDVNQDMDLPPFLTSSTR